MPFLAPLLTPLIGLIVGAGTIGQAIISLGLSLAAGWAVRRLAPKPRAAGGRGMRLTVSLDPNQPREVPVGRCASAGSLAYWHTYGTNNNDYLQLVFVLGDLECDALEGLYIDGKACTLQSPVTLPLVTGQPVAEYPGVMWVEFHRGAWDQAADADLVAHGAGRMKTDDRGRGVCYVRVTLKSDAKLYPQGLPRFLWVFRGAKLYDVRQDSTAGGSGAQRWGQPATYAWSDNANVALYNWLRGVAVDGVPLAGMNAPVDALDAAAWIGAMNACDEAVPLRAGGTEPRYRVAGVLDTAEINREVIGDLLATTAGALIDSGGAFRPQPGIAQAAVLAITDDDLIADAEIEITPKESRAELANAVFGSFHDPAQQFESIALPPRISSADEAADGGVHLPEHYALDYVTSGPQGQRILEIFRRRERHQRRVRLKGRSRLAVLEAGDWITWTSARYGYVAQTFEVLSPTLGPDLTVDLVLRETSAGVYAWSAGTDELDPSAPEDLAAGGSSYATVLGIAVSVASVSADGGAARPALHVTWDTITDATVVALKIEYRRVGDTVAIEGRISDPSAGQYTTISGIQGLTAYEVRLLPVTLPERPVIWSGWVAPAAVTPTHSDDVSLEALAVPPETITAEMLSLQAQIELALATASAEFQGSTAALDAEMRRRFGQIADAILQAQTAVTDTGAFVRHLEHTQQTQNLSLAQSVDVVQAQIDDPVTGLPATASAVIDLESRVTATEGGIGDIEARATISINVNGQVIGVIDLAGNAIASVITMLADKFQVAKPDGTGAQTIFVVGDTPAGANRVAVSGDLIVLGSILADHIAANQIETAHLAAGELVAPVLRNASSTSYWNLNTGDFQIG